MKKVLVVLTLVLGTLVSNGQTYHIHSMNKKSMDEPKKYIADIVIGDNTIKLVEFGKTITYQIKSVEGLDKDYIFKVIDSSNSNTLTEIYYNDVDEFISITYLIKRLNGDNLSSTTYYYFNKNNNKTDIFYTKSLGAEGGYSSFMGNSSVSNISYGAWIDFGEIGVEYHTSVGINMADITATDYVNGKTDEWTAGGVSRSIGIFFKSKYPKDMGWYLGGGVQFANIIGLKNVITQKKVGNATYNYNTPTMTDDNKVYPYLTIGYITKLSEYYTFKGGVILSKIVSINIGVGYNF